MRKIIVALLFVALLWAGCADKKKESAPASVQPITQVVGIGKIAPQGGISNLASSASGIVTAVHVKTGDRLKKGNVLITLDHTSQLLAVSETDQQIASQQKSVASAQLSIEQEKIALSDKKRRLQDAQELLKSGAVTGENVRNLQTEYDQSTQQLRKLENDLQFQQARLGELSAQRASKTEALQQATLTAPINGTVLDIIPLPGEALSQYQTYARLAPDAPLMVTAEIDEMFAGKLAVGQKCAINLIGDPKPVANGQIRHISPALKKKSLFSDSGEDMEDRRVREIEVSIEDTQRHHLLIDTKVECTVQLN